MSQSAWDYYKQFLSWDIKKQNHELITRPPEFWEEMGAQKALETFHAAAERVPAYKNFLKNNKINHAKIRTIEDFQEVPLIDKKNYLRQYPLKDLCWDGDLTKMDVISVSSGSTGEPFMWPRDIWQEKEVDHLYELIYRYLFKADKKHSLVVIAFAMGMYIAGPFTFASTLRIAQKGYPLTVVTPSNDISAVLKVIKNLSPSFEQIIIGGYPPLVKDIIDAGIKTGINWKKHSVKLFFGGEGFSEAWRDYINKKIGGSKYDYDATVNMYGSADAALLGIETPTSIGFRRAISGSHTARLDVFASERLPSVLSYNPLFKYFEHLVDNSLLFTSSSGLPLVRYRIGDIGGTISHADTAKYINQSLSIDWRLPIVYLFGRDDFTVHIYGANVYPENIKEALEHASVIRYVTGKFTSITSDDTLIPNWEIKVQLADNVAPNNGIKEKVKHIIVTTLRKKNAEYADAYMRNGQKTTPKVILISNNNPEFTIAIKHPWITKIQ